jgi:hypothetical protein
LNTVANGANHWTEVSVETMYPFGRFPMFLGNLEMIGDMNTLDIDT